jgi:glycosyltransferase involved in cell wall biosynthesis
MIGVFHNFKKNSVNKGGFVYQYLEFMKKKNVKVREIRFRKSFRGLVRVKREFRELYMQGGILVVNFGSVLGLIGAFYPGRKILIIRGSDWYVSRNESRFIRKIRSKLQSKMTRLSLRSYDKIVCVSQALRREVLQFITNSDDVVVLSTPVDLSQFEPQTRRNPGAEDTVIVGVGALNPDKRNKNSRLVIDAVKMLQDRGQKFEIKIASKIPPNEMAAFYSTLDVFVLSSHYEGFPNVIKEALLCGTPCLSTEVSDLKALSVALPKGALQIYDRNPKQLSKILENGDHNDYQFDRTKVISTLKEFNVFDVPEYSERLKELCERIAK